MSALAASFLATAITVTPLPDVSSSEFVEMVEACALLNYSFQEEEEVIQEWGAELRAKNWTHLSTEDNGSQHVYAAPDSRAKVSLTIEVDSYESQGQTKVYERADCRFSIVISEAQKAPDLIKTAGAALDEKFGYSSQDGVHFKIEDTNILVKDKSIFFKTTRTEQGTLLSANIVFLPFVPPPLPPKGQN